MYFNEFNIWNTIHVNFDREQGYFSKHQKYKHVLHRWFLLRNVQKSNLRQWIIQLVLEIFQILKFHVLNYFRWPEFICLDKRNFSFAIWSQISETNCGLTDACCKRLCRRQTLRQLYLREHSLSLSSDETHLYAYSCYFFFVLNCRLQNLHLNCDMTPHSNFLWRVKFPQRT